MMPLLAAMSAEMTLALSILTALFGVWGGCDESANIKKSTVVVYDGI
jgi:hypothetical protein